MYSAVMSLLSQAFHVSVHKPLYMLYFNGPTVLGFWGGANLPDICFSLTGTTSSFWVQHPYECSALTHQKYASFETAVLFCLYVFTLIRLIGALITHILFTRPVLLELRKLHTSSGIPPAHQHQAALKLNMSTF